MIELTKNNYEQVLNDCFNRNKTALVGIATPGCKNCEITQSNISQFQSIYPINELEFFFIDYSKGENILQHYIELYPLLEYPKTIVYYGSWNRREFLEGIISYQELERIESKSRR